MKHRLFLLFSLFLIISTISVSAFDGSDSSEMEDILLISAYDGDIKKVKDLISQP